MSDTSPPPPTGRGDGGPVPGAQPPPPPAPTPGTALYIPPGSKIGADEAQLKAIGAVELLFAARVCQSAADSYIEIARILGAGGRNPNET